MKNQNVDSKILFNQIIVIFHNSEYSSEFSAHLPARLMSVVIYTESCKVVTVNIGNGYSVGEKENSAHLITQSS